MTYFLQPAGASRGSPLFLCLRIAAAGQLGPLVDPPPTSRIPIPSQLSINVSARSVQCQVFFLLFTVYLLGRQDKKTPSGRTRVSSCRQAVAGQDWRCQRGRGYQPLESTLSKGVMVARLKLEEIDKREQAMILHVRERLEATPCPKLPSRVCVGRAQWPGP